MKVKELRNVAEGAFREEQKRLVVDQIKRLLQRIKQTEESLKWAQDAYARYLDTNVEDTHLGFKDDIHLTLKET